MPALVAFETPVDGFLRTDGYDPIKAANRLAQYWKCRHEIFGDRWLLPMTQTGAGALTSTEINLIRKGFLMYLPVEPQPIIFSDLSKAEQDQDISITLRRIVMYIVTVCCNNAVSQTKGVFVVDCG